MMPKTVRSGMPMDMPENIFGWSCCGWFWHYSCWTYTCMHFRLQPQKRVIKKGQESLAFSLFSFMYLDCSFSSYKNMMAGRSTTCICVWSRWKTFCCIDPCTLTPFPAPCTCTLTPFLAPCTCTLTPFLAPCTCTLTPFPAPCTCTLTPFPAPCIFQVLQKVSNDMYRLPPPPGSSRNSLPDHDRLLVSL